MSMASSRGEANERAFDYFILYLLINSIIIWTGSSCVYMLKKVKQNGKV